MTTKHDTTKLENSTYNILSALGKEAQFLYSTIDTYISDAEKDDRPYLKDIWMTMKQESQRHVQMLREALEKEAKEEKLK
jgi:hypothetical protein